MICDTSNDLGLVKGRSVRVGTHGGPPCKVKRVSKFYVAIHSATSNALTANIVLAGLQYNVHTMAVFW